MIEVVGNLLFGILMAFPSKRNRAINKKFKLLHKEIWFSKMLEGYSASALIHMNYSVRSFIEQTDVEELLLHQEEIEKFAIEFKKILTNENL